MRFLGQKKRLFGHGWGCGALFVSIPGWPPHPAGSPTPTASFRGGPPPGSQPARKPGPHFPKTPGISPPTPHHRGGSPGFRSIRPQRGHTPFPPLFPGVFDRGQGGGGLKPYSWPGPRVFKICDVFLKARYKILKTPLSLSQKKAVTNPTVFFLGPSLFFYSFINFFGASSPLAGVIPAC